MEETGCNGKDSLVRFAKVIIKKIQDENKIVIDDDGDPVVNHRFGTGTALESRIPDDCILNVTHSSLRSSQRAAEYFTSNMLQSLKISTRQVDRESDSKTVNASGASEDSQIQSTSLGGRYEFLLREMASKPFMIASLNKVSSIRYRKSSKGQNQGENELKLLESMQASCLFDFSVHHAAGTNMIVVYKKTFATLQQSQKFG